MIRLMLISMCSSKGASSRALKERFKVKDSSCKLEYRIHGA